MKSDREMFESVLSKRKAYLQKKEHRFKIINRTVPVAACFTLTMLLGYKYWHQIEKLPQPNDDTILYTVTDEVVSTTAPMSTTNTYSQATTSINQAATNLTLNKATVNQKVITANTTRVSVQVPFASGTESVIESATNPIPPEQHSTATIILRTTTVNEKSSLPATTTGVVQNEAPEPLNTTGRQTPYVIHAIERDVDYHGSYGQVSFENTTALEEKALYLLDSDMKEIPKEANLFSINGVSAEAMIGVKLADSDIFDTYLNNKFISHSLGELIEKYGLEKYMSCDKAYYDDFSNGYQQRVYYELNDSQILDTLQTLRYAEYVDITTLLPGQYIGKLELELKMDNILSSSFCMNISEDGYIFTNISGAGQTFFIGKENAKNIIDSIVEDYPYYVLNEQNTDVEIKYTLE